MPGVSWGEDAANQHGWAFTYDVTNAPVLANAYASSRYPDQSTPPVPSIAGIWQAGAGFAADSFGNVFLATGNGLADANDDGDSIVRLTSNGAKFWNAVSPLQKELDANDLDLGAGGPVVLPHTSGASRVFVIGKDGSAMLVRVYDDNPDVIQSFQAVQNPPTTCGDGEKVPCSEVFWGVPVYWNGHLYYVGTGDYLKSLPWDPSEGIFTSITPTNISKDPEPSCDEHRSLSLSANGTSGAILWLTRSGGSSDCPAVLDAYNPTTPNSPPIFQWSAPAGVQLARFPMATVAGGHVFLITVDGPTDVGNGPSTLLQFSLSAIQ
jgi:hypothetical protein